VFECEVGILNDANGFKKSGCVGNRDRSARGLGRDLVVVLDPVAALDPVARAAHLNAVHGQPILARPYSRRKERGGSDTTR